MEGSKSISLCATLTHLGHPWLSPDIPQALPWRAVRRSRDRRRCVSLLQGHVYSLGTTLAAALDFVIEPELEPELGPEVSRLLEQMQQERPSDRPCVQARSPHPTASQNSHPQHRPGRAVSLNRDYCPDYCALWMPLSVVFMSPPHTTDRSSQQT